MRQCQAGSYSTAIDIKKIETKNSKSIGTMEYPRADKHICFFAIIDVVKLTSCISHHQNHHIIFNFWSFCGLKIPIFGRRWHCKSERFAFSTFQLLTFDNFLFCFLHRTFPYWVLKTLLAPLCLKASLSGVLETRLVDSNLVVGSTQV